MIELISARRSSSATPGQFFARWTDHATWAQWSPDTEWLALFWAKTAGRGFRTSVPADLDRLIALAEHA